MLQAAHNTVAGLSAYSILQQIKGAMLLLCVFKNQRRVRSFDATITLADLAKPLASL